MKLVADYREAYRDLPIDTLEFFDINNAPRFQTPQGQSTMRSRTVQELLEHLHKKQDNPSSKPYPQPAPVDAICKRMVEFGWLSYNGWSNKFGGGVFGNSYMGVLTPPYDRHLLNLQLNNAIYGWPCIYDTYLPAVIPVLHEAVDGISSIGTAFVAGPATLVTAAHCVVGARTIAIKGVAPTQLRLASVYVSANDAVDLAVVHLNNPVFAGTFAIGLGQGNVLDDVMVLGYPNVPGFHPALAAEKAMISSRFTAIRGAVASSAEEIFARASLFLITARVRGGFSGGPVLNSHGHCVGVVSREPASQSTGGPGSGHHLYDNLGYGTAIPTALLEQILAEVGSKNVTHARLLGAKEVSWTEFQ